jgi:hypothetical protein
VISAALALVALVAAGGFSIAGGKLVSRGLGHLLPEHRGRFGNGAFWTLDRYTPEGRHLLVRGWLLQAASALLLLFAAISA